MAISQGSISVFDLPNIRQRPPYQELLQALESLKVSPATWAETTVYSQSPSEDAGISRYLTSIISCMFEWFEDSENYDSTAQKEILWELASRRMTERCGRSAMGEMTRTWIIPASSKPSNYQFEMREPPLTGDSLGLKTWGTAFAISKKLEAIKSHYLNGMLEMQHKVFVDGNGTKETSTACVLELGAGTGLVGIAAAAIWSAKVILTDLDDIYENLKFNIEKNEQTVTACGGRISGAILDWNRPEEELDGMPQGGFDIIIAADSLYDENHPRLVANVISRFIRRNTESRALIAVPMRDEKTRLLAKDLRDNMAKNSFKLFHEGWEVCRDDWERLEDDEEVQCWWGLFGFGDGGPRH